MKTIFQSAVDNWPEDEAFETLCWMQERAQENDPASPEELAQVEARLFNNQPDRDTLLDRYRARIAKGLLS